MPDLIIIRLHPVNPTDGPTFTSYLTKLNVTAFDLSFDNSAVGTQIGQASGVWTAPSSDPNDPNLHKIDIAKTQIVQHFSIISWVLIPFLGAVLLFSARQLFRQKAAKK